MYTLKIENSNGNILELTNNSNYIIENISGLTPPVNIINRSACGTIDGAQFNSIRVSERNIVITILPRNDVEKSRLELYKYFRQKDECKIYFKNDSRDVYIKGYIETFDGDLFAETQTLPISIICNEPYWKGLEIISTELSYIYKLFEFPFEISEPISVSEIQTTPSAIVKNSGDVPCGCLIRVDISNTITDFVIRRANDGAFFQLSGSIGKCKLLISTVKNNLFVKKIVNNVEVNMLGYLCEGSTWFELETGNNLFYYTCSNPANVEITFENEILYGGV